MLTLLSCATAIAQKTGVKITEIIGADNSLHIMAEPSGFGTFTVWLTITGTSNTANNAKTPYEIARTFDSKTEIASFAPVDSSRPAKAEYLLDWINGKVNALPDLGFVYRLPVGNGLSTKIRNTTPAQADMSRNNTSNFRIWQFSAAPGDPVFAVRKGIVVRAEDGGRPESGDDQWANATIVIEHSDGTQAIYTGLKGGSVAVAAGDTVLPSQRIGSAGKFFDNSKGVRVGIYSYISNRNKGAYPNMKIQSDFINPLYSTSSGNTILEDDIIVTSKVSSKVLKAENGSQNIWQRMLSIIQNATDGK